VEKETRSDSPTGLVDSVVSADELCAKADVASRRSAAEASILFECFTSEVCSKGQTSCVGRKVEKRGR
jgi:hypothetical protein